MRCSISHMEMLYLYRICEGWGWKRGKTWYMINLTSLYTTRLSHLPRHLQHPRSAGYVTPFSNSNNFRWIGFDRSFSRILANNLFFSIVIPVKYLNGMRYFIRSRGKKMFYSRWKRSRKIRKCWSCAIEKNTRIGKIY
jgi:hypothetical protein